MREKKTRKKSTQNNTAILTATLPDVFAQRVHSEVLQRYREHRITDHLIEDGQCIGKTLGRKQAGETCENPARHRDLPTTLHRIYREPHVFPDYTPRMRRVTCRLTATNRYAVQCTEKYSLFPQRNLRLRGRL